MEKMKKAYSSGFASAAAVNLFECNHLLQKTKKRYVYSFTFTQGKNVVSYPVFM